MTKIIFNGKTVEFDRIVGYGCSFMAAAECLDHTINSDFQDREVLNALKEKFKHNGSELYKFLTSKKFVTAGKVDESIIWQAGAINYDLLFDRQKENSWVKKLAELFDVPCYNRAWSGGSMQSMQYFHEEDVLNGQIKDTDLIVVGMTSFVRWFFLDKKGHVQHPLFGYLNHNWVKDEFYNQFMDVFGQNHPFIIHNALNSIRYFHRLPNPVLFVCSFTNEDQYRAWHPLPPDSTISKMFDQTFSEINLLQASFHDIHSFDYSDPEARKGFAGMHPTLEHHEKFAKKVYKELTSE